MTTQSRSETSSGRRKSCLLLLAGVLGAALAMPGQATAAPITYNLVNDAVDQNGWTLGGTITTDGALGSINTGDITSWTLSFSKGATTDTFSSADPGAAVFADNIITATATAFTVNVNNGQIDFADNQGNTQLDWGYNQYLAFVNSGYLWSVAPVGYPANGIWTIATAPATTPVPEPSSLLLLPGLVGLAAYARFRRDGPQNLA